MTTWKAAVLEIAASREGRARSKVTRSAKFRAVRDDPKPLVVAMMLWAVALMYVIGFGKSLPPQMREWDFSIYYSSATALRLGLNPYQTSFAGLAARLGLHTGGINLAADTPTFLLCFEPLTRLSVSHAFWIWTGLSVVAFAGSLFLLVGPRSGFSSPATAWLLAGFAVLYQPVTNHFIVSQSQILVLFLLTLMMRCTELGYQGTAGLVLAIAGLLRAYPLLLVVYLALKRRWRTLAFTAAGLAVGGFLTMLIVGPTRALSFLGAIGFGTGGRLFSLPGRFALSPSNVSLHNFVAQLFALAIGRRPTLELGTMESVATVVAGAFLIVLTLNATDRDTRDEECEWRQLCLWIALMIALSPVAWIHYMVLLLIPFSQLALASLRNRASMRAVWMAIASYALAAAWPSAQSTIIASGGLGSRLMATLALIPSLAFATAWLSAYWLATDHPRIIEKRSVQMFPLWSSEAER